MISAASGVSRVANAILRARQERPLLPRADRSTGRVELTDRSTWPPRQRIRLTLRTELNWIEGASAVATSFLTLSLCCEDGILCACARSLCPSQAVLRCSALAVASTSRHLQAGRLTPTAPKGLTVLSTHSTVLSTLAATLQLSESRAPSTHAQARSISPWRTSSGQHRQLPCSCHSCYNHVISAVARVQYCTAHPMLSICVNLARSQYSPKEQHAYHGSGRLQ
jgi:hypothetical protein